MAAGREWKVQDGEQNSNFNKTHKSEHDLSPQLTSSKVRIPSLTFNFRILICSINCEHSFFFSSSLSLKFFSQTSNHPQDYPFIFPTINNNLKEPHMFQQKLLNLKGLRYQGWLEYLTPKKNDQINLYSKPTYFPLQLSHWPSETMTRSSRLIAKTTLKTHKKHIKKKIKLAI